MDTQLLNIMTKQLNIMKEILSILSNTQTNFRNDAQLHVCYRSCLALQQELLELAKS